ncbi:hypothetical protein OAI07_02165 [Akkermansiaceae bacterium]|nr:hypothetical protein [Akkermansiaceae bacterium]
MKPLAKKTSLISLFLAISLAPYTSARTFTDNQGRKIEATVIEVLDDSVQLKLDHNEKLHTVPFSKLSKEDVDHLQSLAADEPEETDKPKEHTTGRANSTSAIKAQYGLKDNFDAPWPGLISIDIKVETTIVAEDEGDKMFIYHSPNYEFVSDVRLSQNVVNKFSVMFEATREYCRLLPVSTMKAHVPGAKHRNKILLFEEYDDYIKNGGLPDSAGVYIGGKDIVMVPLQSLGVKKVGSGYMFDYDKSNKTLIHEIIHQLTDFEYYAAGARGWFSEGFAEYCANTPYRSGKFLVKTNASSIKAYATAYGKDGNGGRNLGDDFNAPSLQSYMMMSYEDFWKNNNFNYGFGMLLTYYFFHMEEDTSNITNFMKALKDGKQGTEAIDVLLNGRSYEELEEQVSKKWRSKGVKITFPSSK